MSLGGMFGITELSTAQNVSALILMALISIGVMVLLSVYVGVHGKDSATIIILLSAILTIMFFAVGWLNPVVMIVIIILEGFMLVRMLKI